MRAERVRPVRLERHGHEAVIDDQTPCEIGAQRVEVVRPVRRLADEHGARRADAGGQGGERRVGLEWTGGRANREQRRCVGGGHVSA